MEKGAFAKFSARSLMVLPVLCLTTFAGIEQEPLYSVKSEFGDPLSCDMIPQGIFLVWWDVCNDLADEAAVLLDSMCVYRDICLDSLDMEDPPNPLDGYYFNVYLHETGDVFPDGWACGVGTDMYGYPYMTLPIGCLEDWITISHETFHAFQYSGDSPGFQHPDANWYVEASANWFAAINYPMHENAFVESQSLVKLPHVSIWLGYANFPDQYPENWQRYVHQYAMALFLFYLTEVQNVPDSCICGGFYSDGKTGRSQDLLPQEYIFQELGGDAMRNYFIDWAAGMTNDFDFILPSQRAMALEHWNTYADPEDDNEFVQVYENSGSEGWYRPPDSLVTTGWSFNTFKILNTYDSQYSFHLLGDSLGSAGDQALFRGKILVINQLFGGRFYDMDMLSDTEGVIDVDVNSDDTEIFLIVASMPGTFTDVVQTYSYQVDIQKDPTSLEETRETGPAEVSLEKVFPNPFSSSTCVQFFLPVSGPVRMNVYDLNGRLVDSLIDAQTPSGRHVIQWDGMDAGGETVPVGLYLVSVQSPGSSTSGMIMRLP